jgi:hypothetical protein
MSSSQSDIQKAGSGESLTKGQRQGSDPCNQQVFLLYSFGDSYEDAMLAFPFQSKHY